jgi:hypothetical protein
MDDMGNVIKPGQPGYDVAMDQQGGIVPRPNDALGFMQQIYNAGRNLHAINPFSPVLDAIDNGVHGALDALGVPRGETSASIQQKLHAGIDARVAQGQTPGLGGQIAGAVVGSAPAMLLGGQGLPAAIMQGAVGGGLLSNAGSPQEIAADMVGGAFGGGATHGLLAGIGGLAKDVVLPKITPNAQRLLDAGMTANDLTPGMLAGKRSPYGLLEGAAQVVPVTGEMIRAQGNDALKKFVKVAGDQALAPIGADLQGATGHELYQSAQAAKNAAYNNIGNGISIPIDAQFGSDLASVAQSAKQNLPQDLASRFERLIGREFNNPTRIDFSSGTLQPGAAADIKAAINKEIGRVKNPSLFESDYVDHLKGLRSAVTDALGRASPDAQQQLAQADAAYPGFKIFENAVKRSTQNSTAPEGYFTPEMLRQAIASKAPQSATAAAADPLYKLAQAGNEVLPRKFKDVTSVGHAFMEGMVPIGVAGSDILGGHGAGAAMAIPAIASMGAYTKPVQAAISQHIINSQPMRGLLDQYLQMPLPQLANRALVAGGAQLGRPVPIGLLSALTPQQ